MADYKTPGVYVEEITTLPPSVGQVPTAIPAFIGYTEKASLNGRSIVGEAKHIGSMLDFVHIFGGACDYQKIHVKVGKDHAVNSVEFEMDYYLYDSVRMYFANGGGECYIMAVGLYGEEVDQDKLISGVLTLEKEDHPTILVCPDAMLLSNKDQAYSVQQAMLAQCNKLQDRVAVLDVYQGHNGRDGEEDVVLNFRNGIGVNHLKYGAAYYPWVQTTLSCDFGFEHIHIQDHNDEEITLEEMVADTTNIRHLREALADWDIVQKFVSNPFEYQSGDEEIAANRVEAKYVAIPEGVDTAEGIMKHQIETLKGALLAMISLHEGLANNLINNEMQVKVNASSAVKTLASSLLAIDTSTGAGVVSAADFELYDLESVGTIAALDKLEGDAQAKKASGLLGDVLDGVVEVFRSVQHDAAKIKDALDKVVFDTIPVYRSVVNAVQKQAALLPTSGAIAGVYAQVDGDRGVWKAPANVSLSSVVGPWIKLDNAQQEDLNVDVNAGKSVNAVRAFTGKGTLVWGARTLAGNDNEWRYVSVRRFFNMVEKSVRNSTSWAVFEPNDATTWIRVKAMIENYLTNLWQQGALAGAAPASAFFVNVGLGTTMSQVDILEGRMNIEIGMAVVRPAEFIVLKFSHKLQES